MFFYSGLFSKAYIPENQNAFPFMSTLTLSISEAEIYFHWNFLFYSAILEDNQAQKDKRQKLSFKKKKNNFLLKSKCYWHLVIFFLLFVTKVLGPKIQDTLLNSILFPILNKPQLEVPN